MTKPTLAIYTFPNGDQVTAGVKMFERILDTRETATGLSSNQGSHKDAVYTYQRVRDLCFGKDA